MIKFFRKIRQKMLTENKFSKYLIYAIGEIILVVIGIFIAIQLNNLNQLKEREANGIKTLEKLKEEIILDIVYMDSLKIDYYNWNKQAQYLLDSILTGNLPKLERLNQYKVGTGTMSPLILNKSSYNELLNSENNVEIKDKQLKYEIVSVFQEIDIELSKLNNDNERFNLWAYNNVDVGLFHRLRSNRNLDFEDWKWLQNPAS